MALAFRSAAGKLDATAGTTCSLAAPAGIVDDDILIFMMDRAVVTGAVTLSGFTQIALVTHDGGTLYVAWKRASSESGTYDATWTGDSRYCGIIYAVSGALTTGDPTTIATTTGTGTTPDCPSADPGVSDDYLAIACYGQEGKGGPTRFTPPSSPNAYTEPANSDFGTSGSGSGVTHCGVGASYRTYTGQAEDPGTATSATSDGWATATIIIDPVDDESSVSSASSNSSSSSQQSFVFDLRRMRFRPLRTL